jgi:cytidine deaminase
VIDWPGLRAAADAAAQHAYAPYSKLRVGAAVLTESGEIHAGCNVENASFGMTLCAECGAVSAAIAAGAESLVAMSCCAPEKDELLMPCGRCRQILYEFGGPELLVDGPYGPVALGDLLKHAFGPDDL